MPYSLSANVLTIIASVCGLWASFLDFQEFDEQLERLISSFRRESVVRIPKKDFLGYDAKFTSRIGEDWLFWIRFVAYFFKNLFKELCREAFAGKHKFPIINSQRVRRPCFIHYKIAV